MSLATHWETCKAAVDTGTGAWGMAHPGTRLPPDMLDMMYKMLRRTFYAGAQSCFTEMMTMLEPGVEPTDEDLKKVDALYEELQDFWARG